MPIYGAPGSYRRIAEIISAETDVAKVQKINEIIRRVNDTDIWYSPDGTAWQVSIDNAGNIIRTVVSP